MLSLLEHFTIDFTFHFILSIIDVHLDAVSRDKLIFPSTITRILRHFSIHFPSSDHFPIMCAIDYTIVKRSEAQHRVRQSDSATPPSHSTPSRSNPSSSLSDVTLGDVMVQFQRMDTLLYTLSTELYQVNIRVGRRWQATIGRFAPEATPSPPPPVVSDSEDEDDDDGDDDDALNDADGDASSIDASSIDEMST